MIPLSILIIALLLYIDRIILFRMEMRERPYSYRNIMNLGLIVFMSFLILKLIMIILKFGGIDDSITSVMRSAEAFAYVVLPIAFFVSLMVSLSNISLMRKEGVNWRNMLGTILGVGLCLMTVLPGVLYTFLLRHQIVDIFNEKGIATQVYALFENALFFVVAYLECILLGTVVLGIRAARHIPAFDKDYILILGSQIRPDGTLTPLLKSRADRAVEFAEMQKKASGKEIIFVPSGGKGEDEVMAEADAIGSYLISKGLPKERILTENQSTSTYENIRNSMQLIKEDFEGKSGKALSVGESDEALSSVEPKAAFSTTNYHVFRAGLIAYELGCRMEGIGSPTRRYFWVNAFIREFVATLVSERRHHVKVFIALLVGVFVMVVINYLSLVL